MRKTKKITITKLKKKLWIELRRFIKERSNYICDKCGSKVKGTNAHCSHVLSMGKYPNIQFEPDNLKTLCFFCHIGSGGWHKDPIENALWFLDKYPGKYERLKALAKTKPLYTKDDLLDLLLKYRRTDP